MPIEWFEMTRKSIRWNTKPPEWVATALRMLRSDPGALVEYDNSWRIGEDGVGFPFGWYAVLLDNGSIVACPPEIIEVLKAAKYAREICQNCDMASGLHGGFWLCEEKAGRSRVHGTNPSCGQFVPRRGGEEPTEAEQEGEEPAETDRYRVTPNSMADFAKARQPSWLFRRHNGQYIFFESSSDKWWINASDQEARAIPWGSWLIKGASGFIVAKDGDARPGDARGPGGLPTYECGHPFDPDTESRPAGCAIGQILCPECEQTACYKCGCPSVTNDERIAAGIPIADMMCKRCAESILEAQLDAIFGKRTTPTPNPRAEWIRETAVDLVEAEILDISLHTAEQLAANAVEIATRIYDGVEDDDDKPTGE